MSFLVQRFVRRVACATLAMGATVRGAEAPPNLPDAIVDLRTAEGLQQVNGAWRYGDAAIVEVEHRQPGPDLKASGPPNRTHDIQPHAGAGDFDDGGWPIVDPATLEARRSTGRLAFGWYRLTVTLPERVGAFDPSGAVVVLELVCDDYAEIWVNGLLPQVLGQTGGPLVAGWNAPNRVVLTRDARAGQRFQIAVFGANAPLSDPPANFIWLRSATLDFYRPQRWSRAVEVTMEIDRRDAELDSIVPAEAKLERVASGFTFTEGPVWVPPDVGGAGASPAGEGYLLLSDPNRNTIYRCTEDGDVSVFRTKSGYTGMDIAEYRQPGSNGLAIDRQGRLTICEHGNRRVTRLEKNGSLTVLADRYDGKRLNSPNDLVYRSDGALFFTDPFFGLPRFAEDRRRQQPCAGVYALVNGSLKRVSADLTGPNGLAFSPDEKHLYVCNWDDRNKVLMRYEVARDGTLTNGTVFFDMTAAGGETALDGIKVDQHGHLFVSGPGGLWVLAADGRHLGTLRGPEHPHNLAWGGQDRRTLYWAAQTGIYRIRLNIPGTFSPAGASGS